MALLDDLKVLLDEVEELASQSFFCEDFAAYPNNENSLEVEVRERLSQEGYREDADMTDDEREKFNRLTTLAKDITYECVDNYGGEDCGREYYWIWQFTRGDEKVAIRFDGWYASHYGSEYEQWFVVKEVQKTVTVWE